MARNDIDPTASEFISSGYIQASRPGGKLYDPVTIGSSVAAGAIGNALFGSSNRQATNSATQAADPYSSQRSTWFHPLQDLAFQDEYEMFRQQAATEPYLSAYTSHALPSSSISVPTTPDAFHFDQSDPSYQFRLQQGQQALERSAAAKGMGLSGNALQALSDYGQQSASQEYQNAFNRYKDTRAMDTDFQFKQFASEMGLYAADIGKLGQDYSYAASQRTANESSYANQFSRLSSLAGVGAGSPGTAGQLLGQQYASNLQAQNAFMGSVTQGITPWMQSLFNPSPSVNTANATNMINPARVYPSTLFNF